MIKALKNITKQPTSPLILTYIFTLNILDAILTIAWIKLGIASEANPLMAKVLSFGFLPFFFIKVLLVAFALGILWKLRDHALSNLTSLIAAVFMTAVIVYHFAGAWFVLS